MADRASFLAPAADKPWYVDFSTPPSRSKRFGYRVWFGLILLMESAIGRKQVAKLASFAPELAAEFRTYTFVQMSLHVLFDLLALALLNALHPRVGVRVPRSPPHDARAAPAPAPAPVLRVRPEIPILARHSLKLALRVATIALRVSCFEGYSMKQCLLMTITPTAFAHGFVKHSFAACAAMGCVNYAFVRVVAAFTPAAYSFTSDGMRGDLFADVAPDELAAQLRDVVAPVVFASSFICQFLFSGSEWFSTRLKALYDPADASGGSLRAAADAVDASMRDEDAFPGLRAASEDPDRRGTFWRPRAYAIDPLAFEVLPTEALPDSPEARARFKPLGHPARRRSRRLSSTPGASAFETRVRRRRCVAAGCADRVDASSVVRDGLELCAFHHTATTAFQRRAYPVVAAVRDADPTTTAFDSAAASDRLAEYRRLSNARKAPGRSFVASVWYKTHSDPSTAAAALGATVADVVADAPGGGASVLALAVMSVRPGCSLVTVDASGDFDASDSSSESGSGSGNTGRTSGRSGRSRARRWEDDVDALASALASRGAARRLRGTLVFRAADPVTGASRTTRAEFRGERGERGEGGGDFAPEPEFVEEAFADAAAADAFFSEYVDGSDERYSLIARAALVRECVRARDPGSAMKTLLGGADERRRTMSLPLPPPGHAYSLRCGGSYVPLLARRPSTAEIKDGLWGYASVVVSRTDAEGLGFLELVEVPALRGGGANANANPDPAAPGGSSRRSAAKPPIFTLPVFLTPDADLHAELDGAARLVDAVPLFNLGAALAAGAPDEDADAWSARDAASFHAACACASQGWSVALGRALDATFQTNPNEPGGFPGHGNGEHARVPGRVSPPFGFNPTLRGDRMSEGTDTATESSGAATPGAVAAAPLDAFGEPLRCRLDRLEEVFAAETDVLQRSTLATRAGIAALLRAACSSGSSATVRVALAKAIRRSGVAAVGDAVTSSTGSARAPAEYCSGDDAGRPSADEGLDEEGHVSEAFERCWTPLHAAAAAMARARRTRDGRAFAWVPARISAAARSALETAVGAVAGASFARRLFVSRGERDAAEAALFALTIATDPLAWVARDGHDAPPSPFELARGARAFDAPVVDALADAVARAASALEDVRVAKGGEDAEDDDDADENAAGLGAFARASAAYASAASKIAAEYDGSVSATMAAALVSPGSGCRRPALRARADAAALEGSRGALGPAEAEAWLVAGAPPEGFDGVAVAHGEPRRVASERVSARLGPRFLLALVLLEGALRLFFVGRGLEGGGVLGAFLLPRNDGGDLGAAILRAAAAKAALAFFAAVACETSARRRWYLRRHLGVNFATRLALVAVDLVFVSNELVVRFAGAGGSKTAASFPAWLGPWRLASLVAQAAGAPGPALADAALAALAAAAAAEGEETIGGNFAVAAALGAFATRVLVDEAVRGVRRGVRRGAKAKAA